MSKLFNWAAARLVAAFALALCFATPLVSWADAITAVNPVTGETEMYTYKYVGQSSTWTANDWQNDADPVANPDNAPQTPSSNVWDPILIDGSYTLTAPILEGWAIRLGLYNGAQVTVPTLNKIQASTTMWFTVDATSKLTLSLPGTGHLGDNQNVNFYVAASQGLVFNSDFATSQNDTDTFNYYLAGSGSVSFQGISAGTHKIKMADVTLSGSATPSVESKTLVSFTSTTKTFTADAAIKVYGTDGETLVDTVNTATVNTTGTTTLTEESAVGSCELVQTSTGIDLYYVDGDPDDIVAKTYKPSISVNFCHGNAPLTTAADVGVGDYAVPGTSWNNMISAGGNNGTFSTPLTTIYKIDSTGATSLISGASVAVSGTRGSWNKGNVTAGSDVRNGYIDDNDSNASPQFVVEGIPYYSYKTIIYFASDNNDTKFGYVTVNGENFKGDLDNTATVAAEVGDIWGAASDTTFTEGGNYLVIPTQVNTDGTLTVVSHRLAGCRAGLAAVQIIEVPKTAEEGELVINVSGDTTYTVSENATYTTVYVTGAGTLAFDGEGIITTTTLNVGAGATVPLGSSITPTTVTGAGTVVCDNVSPGSLGWSDNANWKGVLWLKNYAIAGLNPDTLANASSTLRLTACTGYFNDGDNTKTCEGTLDLQNGTGSYAFAVDNGWSTSGRTVFAKLTGSGTLGVQTRDIGQRYVFRDASGFTGNINIAARPLRVVFGDYDQLSSDPDEGTITVAGGAEATLASGATWTANKGGFRVFGTLNVNGTLASSATATAVKGSGTVVFTGSAPSPTGDAWWKNSAWTGTVQMKDVTNLVGGTNWTGTNFLPNDYGNTGSVLELYNCSGWLPNNNNYQCTVPLKVTGTLTINDGISGNKFVISHLSGSGAIYTTSNSATTTLQILEADGFTGYVQLNSKRVVFGNTLPSEYTVGNIYVGEGFSFTVPNSNVAWYGTGGITLAGELKAAALSNFGGGTTITTTDTGVFTLVSNSNTDDMDVDYTRIQGTGTLKFDGTNYRTISTNNFPTAMIVENNLNNGLIHRIPNLEVTIGSLSGSGQMRSDWGGSGSTGDRDLRILQAKDTTYSGLFASSNDRIDKVYVAPGASTAGTLTLSGTQTASNGLIVETGASVNLTGTWIGATTVAGTIGGTGTLTGNLTFSDGATLKANASALTVSGTVTIPAGAGESLTIDAADLDADEVTILSSESITTETDVSKVTVDGLYTVEAVAGALKLVSTRVEVTVPAINNATVTVSVGGETIGTEAGTYKVAPDAVVTATYAAEAGYEISGQTVYTINVSNSETTFDPAGTTEVKQYVASITAGETTTKYTTLQAAIDAVAQNKDIVLLANEADGATVSREITFHVVPGEYTYGDIAAGGDYILTTTALEGKTRYTFAQAVIAVTINEVRTLYTMMTANTGIETANAGPIGTTIEILSGDPSTYVEYLPMFDLNTDTGIFTKVANPVAAVYDGVLQVQVYRTLAAAVDAATAGQTVKLLADVALDSTVVITNSVTLDLNGNDIAATGVRALWIKSGSVSITGEGVVSANGNGLGETSSVIRVGDGATNTNAAGLTIGANVAVESAKCYGVTAFGKNTPGITLVVNGTVAVTSSGEADAAISGNGSPGLAETYITINSGATVTSANSAAIYNPGAGTLTVNGGTITGKHGIVARAGSVAVNGGTITATGTAQDAETIGDSANVIPCAAIAYDAGANYPGFDDGTAIAVTGGTFTSNVDSIDTTGEPTVAVSGGEFSSAVPAEYCAEGYEPTDDGKGHYTVRVDLGWIYEAEDHPNYTGGWSNSVAQAFRWTACHCRYDAQL